MSDSKHAYSNADGSKDIVTQLQGRDAASAQTRAKKECTRRTIKHA